MSRRMSPATRARTTIPCLLCLFSLKPPKSSPLYYLEDAKVKQKGNWCQALKPLRALPPYCLEDAQVALKGTECQALKPIKSLPRYCLEDAQLNELS